MTDYEKFIQSKRIEDVPTGIDDVPELGSYLFDYQKDIVRWLLKRGRGCVFADCGMGKTIMQLEWAKVIVEYTVKPVLIIAPLAVSDQTIEEAKKFGIEVNKLQVNNPCKGIYITNYEQIHNFDLSFFAGIALDESSILKSYTGKYRNEIIESTKSVKYRTAFTATPAPNDFMELGNHAEFIGAINNGFEMLSMFFINDAQNKNGEKWRLKGHAEGKFFEWVASWAVMITKPSDLGYSDEGFILPKLNIYKIEVDAEEPTDGFLFAMPAKTLQERQSARRNSIEERCRKAAKLANKSDETFFFWGNLNTECDEIEKQVNDCVQVSGSDKDSVKMTRLLGFAKNDYKAMVSKPKIAGFGMNYQNCHNTVFVGLSDSYEQYYQATRRFWRFGQKHEVNVFIVYSELEGNVIKNIERKEEQAKKMQKEMVRHMHKINEENIKGITKTQTEYKTDESSGEGWKLYLNDSYEVLKKMDSESIGFSIFSPPFSSLYTYSDQDRDLSNCKDDNEFLNQFRFIIKELYRVMMPGRNISFHVMNTTLQKARDGVLGIKDIRGDMIRLFQSVGFVFHSEVCIWKDPGVAMQRTKHMGLLHKFVEKDSAVSRQGLADYLITMSKPGDNPKPVKGLLDHYVGDEGYKPAETEKGKSINIWNRYASPVWMDINPSDTLQYRSARAEKDEKHMTPTQLQVIHRALQLWSLKGDVVFSPFAGIGSEGYEAIKMGREFIGVELKESYYEQAKLNLNTAVEETKKNSLF